MIVELFAQARKHRQAVVFLPRLDELLELVSTRVAQTLRHCLASAHALLVISYNGTASAAALSEACLPGPRWEPWKCVLSLVRPDQTRREAFVRALLASISAKWSSDVACAPAAEGGAPRKDAPMPAPKPSPPSALSETDRAMLLGYHSKHRLAIRQYFGMILEDLKKTYRAFVRPLDPALDYRPPHPMDLGRMEERVLEDHYTRIEDLLVDVDSIVRNAEALNNPTLPWQRDTIVKVCGPARRPNHLSLPRALANAPCRPTWAHTHQHTVQEAQGRGAGARGLAAGQVCG